jgi:hypothetical protein
VNLAVARSDRSVRKRACRLVGPDEHARLSGVADELLDRRVGVGRREEPPRYESGFRAHGSNQQFHRLLRHAVARALTTAPSLAGVSPAAADILIRHRWRRKGRPGRCRTNGAPSALVVDFNNNGSEKRRTGGVDHLATALGAGVVAAACAVRCQASCPSVVLHHQNRTGSRWSFYNAGGLRDSLRAKQHSSGGAPGGSWQAKALAATNELRSCIGRPRHDQSSQPAAASR